MNNNGEGRPPPAEFRAVTAENAADFRFPATEVPAHRLIGEGGYALFKQICRN